MKRNNDSGEGSGGVSGQRQILKGRAPNDLTTTRFSKLIESRIRFEISKAYFMS